MEKVIDYQKPLWQLTVGEFMELTGYLPPMKQNDIRQQILIYKTKYPYETGLSES